MRLRMIEVAINNHVQATRNLAIGAVYRRARMNLRTRLRDIVFPPPVESTKAVFANGAVEWLSPTEVTLTFVNQPSITIKDT